MVSAIVFGLYYNPGFFKSLGSLNTEYCRPLVNPSINTTFLKPISKLEIYKSICTLPNKCICGIVEIPLVLVKTCIIGQTLTLTNLIRHSFLKSTFPTLLK